MDVIQDLETRVQKIEKRNKEVAVVPTLGFLLSTLTLPYFKTLWKKYIYKH